MIRPSIHQLCCRRGLYWRWWIQRQRGRRNRFESTASELAGPEPHLFAHEGPKTAQFPCFSRKCRYIAAISHGNMAQKAVRWQPGHKARLLTRFRRNQPENLNDVATRFLYAPAP